MQFVDYWKQNKARLRSIQDGGFIPYGGREGAAEMVAVGDWRDERDVSALVIQVVDYGKTREEVGDRIAVIEADARRDFKGTTNLSDVLLDVGRCHAAWGDDPNGYYREALTVGHWEDSSVYECARRLFEAGDSDPIGTALDSAA